MADWGMIKNHRELWQDMKPQYFYVKAATAENGEMENTTRHHARLVLVTDHPGIFRVGDVEDFPGVDPAILNALVSRMIETERQKALACYGFLLAHPEAVEERLADLRIEAIETFGQMEKAGDREMQELNRKFYDLTDEERQIRHSYSLQNPWLANFVQLGGGALTHKDAIYALDHIRIHAVVDDPAWLASPIYPSEGKYNKGMVHVIGVRTPGGRVPRLAQGRKRRRVGNLVYSEPHLSITDIIVIPRYCRYRDCLPDTWLTPVTEAQKQEAENARKEALLCLAKQNDGKHILCCQRNRKSRSC